MSGGVCHSRGIRSVNGRPGWDCGVTMGTKNIKLQI